MLSYKLCVTEITYVKRGWSLKIPYLLTGLLSMPFNKLPCMPTRFDTFDNSPIKSEFRHEKLHHNEPSWISQPQPQQPKIKFDNEPMNYDEFKSRYV